MKNILLSTLILVSVAAVGGPLTPDDVQRTSPASARDKAEARLRAQTCRQALDDSDLINYPPNDLYSAGSYRQMGDNYDANQTTEKIGKRQIGTKAKRESLGPQYE